jgi:hypothetical protein
MWSVATAVGTYIKTTSNYSMMNMNNLFNFMITTMEMQTDENKTLFVQNMRINMGITVSDQFKQYVFKKLPQSPLLKFIQ